MEMAQQGKHPYNEIKAILKMYNTANQREISREMTYQDIKSSIDEIYLPAKTSKKTIQKHFQREILVANLSMLCIALYAIRVRPKKGVKGVLPRDWSGPEKKINPNYMLP